MINGFFSPRTAGMVVLRDRFQRRPINMTERRQTQYCHWPVTRKGYRNRPKRGQILVEKSTIKVLFGNLTQ